MAEAFANHYGSDVMRASSAGLSPALATSSFTRKVMLEKNVDIGNHLPRSLHELDIRNIDMIVNMSGYAIRAYRAWTGWLPIRSEGRSRAIAPPGTGSSCM